MPDVAEPGTAQTADGAQLPQSTQSGRDPSRLFNASLDGKRDSVPAGSLRKVSEASSYILIPLSQASPGASLVQCVLCGMVADVKYGSPLATIRLPHRHWFVGPSSSSLS